MKHDGYRIVARKQGERVTLWSRHGAKFTDKLPRIAEAVRGLAAEHALIHGEAVVFRPDGLSDFGARRIDFFARSLGQSADRGSDPRLDARQPRIV